jgi:carbon starvation protein
MDQMAQVVHNETLDGVLAVMFVMVVVSMLVYGIAAIRKARASDKPTAIEVGGPGSVAAE